MPTRNNNMIRRDINRLNELVARHSQNEGALAAIADKVTSATDKVNNAWQAYQAIAVTADKERDERNTAIVKLMEWIQRWRPVIMLKVPGADANIKQLPNKGATPDDAIRVAEDMLRFIMNNQDAQSFAESAVQSLGERLNNARKQTSDATAVLPQEAACRDEYTESCMSANTVLVRGLEIVRTAFGRTSPEYKQFIARNYAKDEEEEPVSSGTSAG